MRLFRLATIISSTLAVYFLNMSIAFSQTQCCGGSVSLAAFINYEKKTIVFNKKYRFPQDKICKELNPPRFGNAYLVLRDPTKNPTEQLRIKIQIPTMMQLEGTFKPKKGMHKLVPLAATPFNLKLPECIQYKGLHVEIISLRSETIARGKL